MARVVDPQTNARLTVVFDNFFARLFGSSRDGNPPILNLIQITLRDGSTPDRRYLWVLPRTPQLDNITYQHSRRTGQVTGFPSRHHPHASSAHTKDPSIIESSLQGRVRLLR